MEVNALGQGTIVLGSGTHTLSLAGSGEGNGDLDIRGNVTIVGDSARNTIIDANAINRVFVVHSGAELSLSNVTVTGGKASSGAGIFNAGVLHISQSNLSNNTATRSAGGGIKNVGDIIIVDSTLSHNTAANSVGGGIYNFSGTVRIANSTISHNSAKGGVGGAIRNQSGGTLTLAHTTIAENTSSNDRAVWNADGNVTVANSIVVGGVGGQYTSEGNNIVGRNAQLGPLQDNGGFTDTHALLPHSHAIDAGDNSVHERWKAWFESLKTSDQSGADRINGNGTVDIGAFEFNPVTRAGSQIVIEGGAFADEYEVRQTGSAIIVQQTGTGHEWSFFGINGITFNGRDGNDTIKNRTNVPLLANGGNGNDTLIGGLGDDILLGAEGVDELFGGDGTDIGYLSDHDIVHFEDGSSASGATLMGDVTSQAAFTFVPQQSFGELSLSNPTPSPAPDDAVTEPASVSGTLLSESSSPSPVTPDPSSTPLSGDEWITGTPPQCIPTGPSSCQHLDLTSVGVPIDWNPLKVAVRGMADSDAFEINDVIQQGTPTCFFAGTLASVAFSSFDLSKNIRYAGYDAATGAYQYDIKVYDVVADAGRITSVSEPESWTRVPYDPNESGQYSEAFDQDLAGRWRFYRDQNGNRGQWLNEDSDIWPLLYHRAFTYHYGLEGGYANVAYAAITGHIGSNHDVAQSQNAIALALENGEAVTVGSPDALGEDNVSQSGIVFDHRYSVVHLTGTGQDAEVTLRNPWGRDNDGSVQIESQFDTKHLNENDGYITLSWSVFVDHFDHANARVWEVFVG